MYLYEYGDIPAVLGLDDVVLHLLLHGEACWAAAGGLVSCSFLLLLGCSFLVLVGW